MTQKNLELLYVPTGLTYVLPEAECIRLAEKEPENFVIADKNYKKKNITTKATTTYEKVVDDNDEVKPLSQYSYKELKEYAKKNKLNQGGNTEELKARCLAHSASVVETEETETEETEA